MVKKNWEDRTRQVNVNDISCVVTATVSQGNDIYAGSNGSEKINMANDRSLHKKWIFET